jgi:hypothetical protein
MEWSISSPTRVSKLKRRHETNPVRVPKVEAQSNSSWSPVRSLGAVRNNQVAYEVGFVRSIYGWKYNFIVSNGIGLMPKSILSQRESSKQIDFQNLPRCCIASLFGP